MGKKVAFGVLFVVNRMYLILAIYVVSLCISSALFSYFEGKSFWDGMWWSVVTALTIGYGDLSPVTVPGRLAGIVFGHFWIFGVIPMIIANIITRAIEDKNRFTHAEQEWVQEALKKLLKANNIECEETPPDY